MNRNIGTCLNHNCYTLQYNVNFDEVENVNRILNDKKKNIAVGSKIFPILLTFKLTHII